VNFLFAIVVSLLVLPCFADIISKTYLEREFATKSELSAAISNVPIGVSQAQMNAAIAAAISALEQSGGGLSPTDRECPIENGTGRQSWTGSAWGTCVVRSCNPGYSMYFNSRFPPCLLSETVSLYEDLINSSIYTFAATTKYKLPNYPSIFYYSVTADTSYDEQYYNNIMSIGGIFPTYYVQSMHIKAAINYACQCRLKRVSDSVNGAWVKPGGNFNTEQDSISECPRHCASYVGGTGSTYDAFRNSLLSEF
jgi:hypothetical protein